MAAPTAQVAPAPASPRSADSNTRGSSPLHADPRRPDRSEGERQRVNLEWLVRLRWLAVLGQLAVIGVVAAGMRIPLPVGYLLTLVGFIALTNVALHLRVRSLSHDLIAGDFPRRAMWLMAAVAAFDVMLLTGLLYGSGGRENPFAVFYLVHVVLGAVLLPARLAWGVAALCLAGYALVFLAWVPVDALAHHPVPGAGVPVQHGMHLHVHGMFVALAVASIVLVHFVSRLTSALRAHERSIDAMREQDSLTRHAHALASFAAGAAHELGSPLTSIAITARELERAAQRFDDDVVEDARIIRQEVERCRTILTRIASDAGTRLGEEPVRIEIGPWLDDVLDGLSRADRITRDITASARRSQIHAPRTALTDALRSVLRNALQASPDGSRVDLRAHIDDALVVIEVLDRGHGMPPDILRRADEPFFTTRGPGDGIGLGLYLTRALLQEIGGRFLLSSREGEGTLARLELPRIEDPHAPSPAPPEAT